MKVRRKPLLAAAVASLAAFGLAACSGSSGSGNTGSAPSGPHKGGTLTFLSQSDSIPHLDPQRDYVGEDFAFENAYLVRTLTSYTLSPNAKTASKLRPDLATGTGKSSNGGRTWSFTLRKRVKWQDGSTVSCKDIKYGISRTFAQTVITNGPTYAISLLDIPTDSQGNSLYKGPYVKGNNDVAAFNKAVTCTTNGSGNQVITFHLNQPAGDFNYTVALPSFAAVPKEKDTGAKYDNEIFSDGPYKIQSYVKGQQLVLVRNTYWKQSADPYRHAYPDKVVVDFSINDSVIDQRMMADAGNDQAAVSMEQLGTQNLQQVFSDSKFAKRRINAQNPYVFMFPINTKKVPNLKQRQAIMAALNRQEILTISGGKFAGDLADGFISPTLGADYAKTGLWKKMFGKSIPPTGDPVLAKKLIKESGKPMPTITFDYGTSDPQPKEAAAVQASLARAGIKVKLKSIPEAQRNAFELNPKTAGEMLITAWASDWPSASTVLPPLFATGGGWSESEVNDPHFNKQVKAAKAETDPAKQANMWQDLNAYAASHAWAIPLRYGRYQRLAGSKVGTVNGPHHHVYLWAPDGSWPYADMYVTK